MARQRKKNGSTVGSAEASGTTPLADCDHDEWLECELTAWKTLFAEPLKGIRKGERGREELNSTRQTRVLEVGATTRPNSLSSPLHHVILYQTACYACAGLSKCATQLQQPSLTPPCAIRPPSLRTKNFSPHRPARSELFFSWPSVTSALHNIQVDHHPVSFKDQCSKYRDVV